MSEKGDNRTGEKNDVAVREMPNRLSVKREREDEGSNGRGGRKKEKRSA